jgi:[ribosomal protein S5]-alanine N-acetyltransferase
MRSLGVGDRQEVAIASPIRTARLELVAATPATLRADLSDPVTLDSCLQARVPEHWPPEFYDRDDIQRYLARAESSPDGEWGLRYIIETPLGEDGRRSVVGVIAFASPPTADGVVEIGYAIVPAARGKGYATEATNALVAFAFRDPRVLAVVAETFPRLSASIRVLEKAGFVLVPGAAGVAPLRFVRSR